MSPAQGLELRVSPPRPKSGPIPVLEAAASDSSCPLRLAMHHTYSPRGPSRPGAGRPSAGPQARRRARNRRARSDGGCGATRRGSPRVPTRRRRSERISTRARPLPRAGADSAAPGRCAAGPAIDEVVHGWRFPRLSRPGPGSGSTGAHSSRGLERQRA